MNGVASEMVKDLLAKFSFYLPQLANNCNAEVKIRRGVPDGSFTVVVTWAKPDGSTSTFTQPFTAEYVFGDTYDDDKPTKVGCVRHFCMDIYKSVTMMKAKESKP